MSFNLGVSFISERKFRVSLFFSLSVLTEICVIVIVYFFSSVSSRICLMFEYLFSSNSSKCMHHSLKANFRVKYIFSNKVSTMPWHSSLEPRKILALTASYFLANLGRTWLLGYDCVACSRGECVYPFRLVLLHMCFIPYVKFVSRNFG